MRTDAETREAPQREPLVTEIQRAAARAKRPDDPMCAYSTNGSTASGRRRELRITHDLLYSDLSATAKLLPAAIELSNSTASYDNLAAILPISNNAISAAVDELERRGYLLKSPQLRQQNSIFYQTTTFRLLPPANPHASYFVRLPLTDDLERSPKPWLLRALCHREQQRAGAYQMPPALAARFTDLTPKSTKNTIRKWVKEGILEEVCPGSGTRTGTYVVSDSFYEPRQDYDPTKYRLRRVTRSGETATVWATEGQANLIATRLQNAPEIEALNILLAAPQPALAGELVEALADFVAPVDEDESLIPF
jgi:hypothetical protein